MEDALKGSKSISRKSSQVSIEIVWLSGRSSLNVTQEMEEI